MNKFSAEFAFFIKKNLKNQNGLLITFGHVFTAFHHFQLLLTTFDNFGLCEMSKKFCLILIHFQPLSTRCSQLQCHPRLL